ncbi:hypothetical protein DPEC_G00308990 [Dallia pectoralis]|uniref:Uncharacterized protein n=1 Tax=Dallia pectoralis TaxID=75939 RepID=A0ACC2FEP3_DALPE|nr:hypothetical protein DPEC_G00308990 [Dallia pectoralis]
MMEGRREPPLSAYAIVGYDDFYCQPALRLPLGVHSPLPLVNLSLGPAWLPDRPPGTRGNGGRQLGKPGVRPDVGGPPRCLKGSGFSVSGAQRLIGAPRAFRRRIRRGVPQTDALCGPGECQGRMWLMRSKCGAFPGSCHSPSESHAVQPSGSDTFAK